MSTQHQTTGHPFISEYDRRRWAVDAAMDALLESVARWYETVPGSSDEELALEDLRIRQSNLVQRTEEMEGL